MNISEFSLLLFLTDSNREHSFILSLTSSYWGDVIMFYIAQYFGGVKFCINRELYTDFGLVGLLRHKREEPAL